MLKGNKSTKSKRKKYIEYDAEEQFKVQAENLNEWFAKNALSNGYKCIYACKEITAGTQFEIEIYPEFTKEYNPLNVKKDNKKAQRELNSKNAQKYCIRLLNQNFGKNDLWITLTYAEGQEPKDHNEAYKNIKNYIKRLRYARGKMGLPPIKYLYITEYDPDAEIRWHHHITMDGLMDIDTVIKAWKKGGRNEARLIEPDEYGLTGMAKYITGECKEGRKSGKTAAGRKKYQRRWNCSTNLKQFRVRKNHYKFKRKDVEEMAKNQDGIKEIMQKKYPDYLFTDVKVKYNGYNSLYYIHVNMREKYNSSLREAEKG